MIDYIIKKNYKLFIAENNDYKSYDMPMTKYFNKLLKPYLSDLKSREKQTRLYFNFNNKVPIYINSTHLFLSIYSYRLEKSLYINYFSIYQWKKMSNQVIVELMSGHCIRIKSYYNFIHQIKKVELILSDSKIKLNK